MGDVGRVSKSPAIIVFISGLCAAGFLGGAAAKRWHHATLVSAVPAKFPGLRPVRRAGEISLPHSVDTAASLPVPGDPAGYARIALWLLDAKAEEIAKYWESVKNPRPAEFIVDLVFTNWTRLDPRGALAAVAGSNFESYAWQGWACNDPQAALAAATVPDKRDIVAWAIGRYHPDWVRAHYDEIPAELRDRALDGLANQAEAAQPLATLDFLNTRGQFNRGLFQTLIRKDPWSAFDWLKRNAVDPEMFARSGEALADLAGSVAESQPQIIARMADEAPPGGLKRGLEAAAFANLLKSDPLAAMTQARETAAPRVAAERLAAVGLASMENDPATARDLAAKLFTAMPDALSGYTWVISDGGTLGSGDPVAGVSEFVTALLRSDPAALLETAGLRSEKKAFSAVAGRWADSDFNAYSGWTDSQPDEALREMASKVVIDRFTKNRQFREAADWTLERSSPESRAVKDAVVTWHMYRPAEAAVWLQAADIPETVRTEISTMLGKMKTP